MNLDVERTANEILLSLQLVRLYSAVVSAAAVAAAMVLIAAVQTV
jgi:hypothetical protein